MMRKSRFDVVARAAAVVSAAILVWTVGERLKAIYERHRDVAVWAVTPVELQQVSAPVFLLETLDGDTIAAPYQDVSGLLIAYLTTCPYCDASLPRWRHVVEGICEDAQVILISPEPIAVQRSYWDSRGGTVLSPCVRHPPIIGRALDSEYVARVYDIQATPTHFVVNAEGEVVRTWIGFVGRAARDSLLAVFR